MEEPASRSWWRSFGSRDALAVVRDAGRAWSEDNALRLGAALSFYAVLALPPIFVVALSIAGLLFGQDIAEESLLRQLSELLGTSGRQMFGFGALLALYVTGSTLNVSSFMGAIMVVGIVHKNGIPSMMGRRDSMRERPRLRSSVAPLLVASFAAMAIAGCRQGGPAAKASPRPSGARSVVVYSSADKEFAELIFTAYEQKTGVKVLSLYDTEETKTAGLTARLVAEKPSPKADVFWSSDTSRAVALVGQGVAAPYASPEAATIPARYKSPTGLWTGFAARIRVILYNTDKVKPGEAPRSILDLAEPRWRGRFAVANPHFGTMSFHAAALFVKWGDEKAKGFFASLKGNGAVIAAGNSDVKDRVSDGRVAAGILDEDDAVVALRDKKAVALVIPDQDGPDPLGTPLMPNAALLVQGAPHPDEARRFIDFLVSAEAETILARSDAAQYPLHPGVAGPALLPPLDQVRVMDVDYAEVAKKLPAMDAAVRSIFGL